MRISGFDEHGGLDTRRAVIIDFSSDAHCSCLAMGSARIDVRVPASALPIRAHSFLSSEFQTIKSMTVVPNPGSSMNLDLNPLYVMNFLLSMIILILGYATYSKTKNDSLLYVGLAFGLFGISHLSLILGYGTLLATPMIWVRLVAYLLVGYALYKQL
jgi:hypothetical protein